MCPTLRSINLNRCGGFCDEGMASIAANCSQLHTLDAVGCDGLSNDAASYQRLARGCQRLKTIDLSECDDVRDECVIVVAKSCPELRFINLSGCKKVSDAGLESLVRHPHEMGGNLEDVNMPPPPSPAARWQHFLLPSRCAEGGLRGVCEL